MIIDAKLWRCQCHMTRKSVYLAFCFLSTTRQILFVQHLTLLHCRLIISCQDVPPKGTSILPTSSKGFAHRWICFVGNWQSAMRPKWAGRHLQSTAHQPGQGVARAQLGGFLQSKPSLQGPSITPMCEHTVTCIQLMTCYSTSASAKFCMLAVLLKYDIIWWLADCNQLYCNSAQNTQ